MILYTSNQSSGTKLVIGGLSKLAGSSATGGLIGPMPRYSIGRENISTGDGTYMGTRFSITVTGTALIHSEDDNQDITKKGERQHRVMGEALTSLQMLREAFPNQGTGKLEISAYGGLGNIVTFDDARLLSVDLPEQNEESAGVQTLEYSFTFEAYQENSNNINTGSSGRPVRPDYCLTSVDESWELSEGDGFFYKDDTPTKDNNTLHKTYTLSHTVSATGHKKYAAASLAADGEAFRQAVQWVKTRLVYDPTIEITQDLMGDATFFSSKFLPLEMNAPGKTDELGFNLKAGTVVYKGYNHTRSVSSDQNVGSYSVTDTWVLSQENFLSTHSLEFNFENSIDGQGATVGVSATVQGLTSLDSRETKTDKYTNALASFGVIKDLIPALADQVYKDSGGVFPLRQDRKFSESIGHNKVAGTITYSVSFNDYDPPKIPGAITENVTVNYNNDKGEQKLIAILQVIGRAKGPIIQDIQTTQISSRTITVDAVMERGAGKPDGSAAISAYRPLGNVFLTSSTESFNPNTRAYNKSETWEFNGEGE